MPLRGPTKRAAVIAAKNRPSRLPFSTSTSVSGSRARGRLKRVPIHARGGAAEWLDALGDRIAAEIGDVFGEDRPDEIRHRVLRFAQ